MVVELKQIQVPLGDRLLLTSMSWQDFEQLVDELGDRRTLRLAYTNGVVELMSPSPKHESAKEFLGDLIKALLEELDMDCYPLRSTTFKHPQQLAGIEPDQCFYIQHEANVRGKDRIDLTIDPPPDLALEIDITSRTHPDIYARLGVSELWRFEKNTLQINRLGTNGYEVVAESSIFPGWPLTTKLVEYWQKAQTIGRNRTLREFRAWVRSRRSDES